MCEQDVAVGQPDGVADLALASRVVVRPVDPAVADAAFSLKPDEVSKPTQGNDSGSIPLGLRDLVKDYFSSLDKKSP